MYPEANKSWENKFILHETSTIDRLIGNKTQATERGESADTSYCPMDTEFLFGMTKAFWRWTVVMVIQLF